MASQVSQRPAKAHMIVNQHMVAAYANGSFELGRCHQTMPSIGPRVPDPVRLDDDAGLNPQPQNHTDDPSHRIGNGVEAGGFQRGNRNKQGIAAKYLGAQAVDTFTGGLTPLPPGGGKVAAKRSDRGGAGSAGAVWPDGADDQTGAARPNLHPHPRPFPPPGGRESPFNLMQASLPTGPGQSRLAPAGPPRAAEGARPGAVELRSDGAPFAPYAAATARRRDETGPLGDYLGMR